jgi:1,4-dihydroxy-2-naphthoate octaprenyltransferase
LVEAIKPGTETMALFPLFAGNAFAVTLKLFPAVMLETAEGM